MYSTQTALVNTVKVGCGWCNEPSAALYAVTEEYTATGNMWTDFVCLDHAQRWFASAMATVGTAVSIEYTLD